MLEGEYAGLALAAPALERFGGQEIVESIVVAALAAISPRPPSGSAEATDAVVQQACLHVLPTILAHNVALLETHWSELFKYTLALVQASPNTEAGLPLEPVTHDVQGTAGIALGELLALCTAHGLVTSKHVEVCFIWN